MADTKTLHCTSCWWTTDNLHAKTCGRCKQPLFLSDGRQATQVVNTAVQQARAYMAVGYDPAYAPGVVAASPILAHRQRSDITWVAAIRALIGVALLTNIAGLIVLVVEAQTLSAYGSHLNGAVLFIFLTVAIAVMSLIATIVMWRVGSSWGRAVILVYAGYSLIKYATLPIYPIVVANLIFYGAFSFLLIMSLLAPSPKLPGRLRLNGPTSTAMGLIVAIIVGLFVWASIRTYHESPKVLNQAQITLGS